MGAEIRRSEEAGTDRRCICHCRTEWWKSQTERKAAPLCLSESRTEPPLVRASSNRSEESELVSHGGEMVQTSIFLRRPMWCVQIGLSQEKQRAQGRLPSNHHSALCCDHGRAIPECDNQRPGPRPFRSSDCRCQHCGRE